jgi:3-oxoacyl-[acyl-carrier protein] reductase
VTTCARSAGDLMHPERHHHVIADVSRPEDVERLFASVRSEAGYLDVLVNNAGVASMNLLALTPTETIQRVMRINVEGTLLVTREALRLLRRSAAGRIVNLSTVAVPLRLAGESVYAASKSAVETFTRVAAKEFGAYGVTCNAIGPSPIRTDLLKGVSKRALDELLARQSIPRWATPDDVINLFEFFANPESGMITGQVVYLGGCG